MKAISPARDYDYVIAGGGSAGCVAAARLSEDPDQRVLLIEAGIDMPPGGEPAEIRSPFPVAIFHGRRYMWPKLRVKPFRDQPSTRFYEQARVLGGGSSINAQVGNPDDYDEWERMGAAGWGWRDVLPYFRKLERDLDYGADSAMHGSDGPVPIYRVHRADWPAVPLHLAQALERRGLRDIADQNGVFEDGYFPVAYTNEHGERVSAARAYLTDAVRRRPNLTIATSSQVLGVTFDGTHATGVSYRSNGRVVDISAGEVILALGALQTPAMLLRAGIGPAAELARHKIAPRVIRDGVGSNLCDHPGTHICAVVKPRARRKGLGKASHLAVRFAATSPTRLPSDLYVQTGITSGWHAVGQRVAYFYIWLNKSRSRGAVRLRDTDPESMPAVTLNLLDEPSDAERLADGFRFVAGLLDDAAMRAVIEPPFAVRFSAWIRFITQVRRSNRLMMSIVGRLLDGPGWLRRMLSRRLLTNAPPLARLIAGDAALKDYLRRNAMSVSHVSGTCRIGAADDPLAVVDSDGRVHGISNLTIIDASVMPSIPRANTNLVVMMIAEKIVAGLRAAG